MLGRVGKGFSSWLAFVFSGDEALRKALPLMPVKQRQRSLAGLRWVRACKLPATVPSPLPSHTTTFGVPGGLGSCRSAWGASMERAETWFFLSCAMERLWGNWDSEVCLGFDLSHRDPPGHLTHSQSVPFIYDSRINTSQVEVTRVSLLQR